MKTESKKKSKRASKASPPQLRHQSILEVPFKEMLRRDAELAKEREMHALLSPEERRRSAEFMYHQDIAEEVFGLLVGCAPNAEDPYRAPLMALAIDSTFAPAILTVGTLEYELNRWTEAIELLMTLATLPEDTEDLAEIIDKAGMYLISEDDFDAALQLYQVAAAAYPTVAVHHNSVGYCLGKLGSIEEAVVHAQRAVDLEPQNALWWSDLGWSLFEAGQLEEAERTLVRAVELSPPDCNRARDNLEEVRYSLAALRSRK